MDKKLAAVVSMFERNKTEDDREDISQESEKILKDRMVHLSPEIERLNERKLAAESNAKNSLQLA